jgi:hypothetical protein
MMLKQGKQHTRSDEPVSTWRERFCWLAPTMIGIVYALSISNKNHHRWRRARGRTDISFVPLWTSCRGNTIPSEPPLPSSRTSSCLTVALRVETGIKAVEGRGGGSVLTVGECEFCCPSDPNRYRNLILAVQVRPSSTIATAT